jgi:hypothetical protein
MTESQTQGGDNAVNGLICATFYNLYSPIFHGPGVFKGFLLKNFLRSIILSFLIEKQNIFDKSFNKI